MPRAVANQTLSQMQTLNSNSDELRSVFAHMYAPYPDDFKLTFHLKYAGMANNPITTTTAPPSNPTTYKKRTECFILSNKEKLGFTGPAQVQYATAEMRIALPNLKGDAVETTTTAVKVGESTNIQDVYAAIESIRVARHWIAEFAGKQKVAATMTYTGAKELAAMLTSGSMPVSAADKANVAAAEAKHQQFQQAGKKLQNAVNDAHGSDAVKKAKEELTKHQNKEKDMQSAYIKAVSSLVSSSLSAQQLAIQRAIYKIKGLSLGL